jgi:hypothetical protein
MRAIMAKGLRHEELSPLLHIQLSLRLPSTAPGRTLKPIAVVLSDRMVSCRLSDIIIVRRNLDRQPAYSA